MAKGYPDFFGFSTYPWYGAITRDYAERPNLATGAEHSIHAIAAKGVCLGGQFSVVLLNLNPDGVSPRLYVDGNLIFDEDLEEMFALNLTNNLDAPVYLMRYSSDLRNMALSISTNMNFNTSFALNVENLSGGNVTIYSSLYYTIIR